MKKIFIVLLFLTLMEFTEIKRVTTSLLYKKYFQPWVEILINLLQFLKNDNEESSVKMQKNIYFKYTKAF